MYVPICVYQAYLRALENMQREYTGNTRTYTYIYA